MGQHTGKRTDTHTQNCINIRRSRHAICVTSDDVVLTPARLLVEGVVDSHNEKVIIKQCVVGQGVIFAMLLSELLLNNVC